jgi:hypothetical protein
MKKYQLEKYVLHNGLTGELEEFPIGNDCESARHLAIERAVEMKEFGPKTAPYQSIELTLELVDLIANTPRVFKVLTGSKMHTEDILRALDSEREIIEDAGLDVEVMVTNAEPRPYKSLHQHFIKLYYFTEAKPYG